MQYKEHLLYQLLSSGFIFLSWGSLDKLSRRADERLPPVNLNRDCTQRNFARKGSLQIFCKDIYISNETDLESKWSTVHLSPWCVVLEIRQQLFRTAIIGTVGAVYNFYVLHQMLKSVLVDTNEEVASLLMLLPRFYNNKNWKSLHSLLL